MWTEEIGSDEKKRENWYKQGVNYWVGTEATVDGVLGGFGNISDVDIQGSTQFLKALPRLTFGRAADCGAGIGRTTKGLLCPMFQSVDLIDPTPSYIAAAKENLKDVPTMGKFFELGLQEWHPEQEEPYDLIFCQWVLPYLIDDDLVAFFQRCIASLAPNGLIVVKENICREGFVLDREDTSITRSDLQYRMLFDKAGLKLVAEKLQTGFPKQLFPVRMWALRPKQVKKDQVEVEQALADIMSD